MRWIHNYRSGNRDLKHANDLFLPDVMRAPNAGERTLPAEGELVVPGYVVTRRFSVFIKDGTEGRVRIRYRTAGGAT